MAGRGLPSKRGCHGGCGGLLHRQAAVVCAGLLELEHRGTARSIDTTRQSGCGGTAVCGQRSGRVVPVVGRACAGRSELYIRLTTTIDPEDTAANLQRWSRITGEPIALARVVDDHAGLRITTRDHLPMIGPLVDEAAVRVNPMPWVRNDRLPLPLMPGLYFAGAFGSRGLLWAALAGELLADMLEGSCLPVERQLAAAVAPARLMQRQLRRHPGERLSSARHER